MTIFAIAIMTEDGDVFSSRDFKASRISLLPCKLMKKMKNNIHGFLNHVGEFLDEEEALIEARLNNQVANIYFSAKGKLLPIHLKY